MIIVASEPIIDYAGVTVRIYGNFASIATGKPWITVEYPVGSEHHG